MEHSVDHTLTFLVREGIWIAAVGVRHVLRVLCIVTIVSARPQEHIVAAAEEDELLVAEPAQGCSVEL
jgi:hypothetical protein